MGLRQRRYFVAIADLGSMSRASQALYIALPPLIASSNLSGGPRRYG